MDHQAGVPKHISQSVGVLSFQRPAEDAKQPESEHLILTVRALSARIIKGWWLDFPAEALKPAAGKLKGMPVMLNHTADVREVVGMVLDAWWDDDKHQGAPGINARLRLNRASAPPNLLREMEADPPLKPGVSVTWFGEAMPSHPRLSAKEFDRRLGEVAGGEVVRWIVTAIDELPEISLVWTGADPAARALSKRTNHDERSVTMTDQRTTGGDAAHVTLAALAPVAQALGLDAAAAGDYAALAEALAAKARDLAAKVNELTPLAETGRAHLGARRRECLRLAGLAKGGEPPEALVQTIQEASLAAVDALIEGFGGQAAASFTARCPECGEEVPIRSSLEAAEPQPQGNEKYVKLGKSIAGKEG